MDIQLPGMNGIEALRPAPRRPEHPRASRSIAVTASAMTQDRQQILAAGFDGYQSKPINVKELRRAGARGCWRPARRGGA